jgi:uncharacterized membrane protein
VSSKNLCHADFPSFTLFQMILLCVLKCILSDITKFNYFPWNTYLIQIIISCIKKSIFACSLESLPLIVQALVRFPHNKSWLIVFVQFTRRITGRWTVRCRTPSFTW